MTVLLLSLCLPPFIYKNNVSVSIKPNYRNKGIGGILIDFMIEKLKCDGYKEITVGVDKDNFAAIHLYRKKGFTKVLFNGGDEQGEYFKLLKKL